MKKKAVGAIATIVTVGFVIAGCSSGSASSSGGTDGSASGGDLVIGLSGNSSESLDPHYTNASTADLLRGKQLFDGLTALTPDGVVEMALAEEMIPNEANDVWTVKLRQGVKFHDGSDLTVEDVIFSIERVLNPDEAARGQSLLSFIEPDMLEKVDNTTLKVNLSEPYGPFADVWSSNYLRIVPEEFDPAAPVGTGPFVYESFTAGQNSVFTRNSDYWGGAPLLDSVEVQGLADTNAILNALIGGQVDVASAVPLSQVEVLESSPNIDLLVSESGRYLPITMRSDIAPFDDERVRRALSLIADRQELVDNALDGYGRVANDWVAGYGPCEQPEVPQRSQDIAEAKRLLAEAGQTDLSLDLYTTSGTTGMIESAVIYSEQAKAAGVDIEVHQLDEASFLEKYSEWPMTVDFYGSPYFELIPVTLLPGGPGNASHWEDSGFISLADQLFETSESAAQCELIDQMKLIEHERGANIVWGWVDTVDAHSDAFEGFVPDVTGKAVFHLNDVRLAS